jgi:hypothetical protein
VPAFDSIFNRNPNTPAQTLMPATLGTVDAPLLLLGNSTVTPSLWINTGVIGTIIVNGASFTDNGWTILAEIVDFPATFSNDPTTGGYIYQALEEPTLSAVLAKLAERATTGALQKWSQAFYRMLSA